MIRERLGPPLVIHGLEITPVESISIRRRRFGDATLFEASKRPSAIVVRSRGRTWRIEVPEHPGRPVREGA